MTKIGISIIAALLIELPVLACNFGQDIYKTDDGRYSYSRDCHVEVGRRVKELDLLRREREVYQTTMDLQEARYRFASERADKLEEINSAQDYQKYLFFAAGVLLTVGAGFAVGQAAVILIP
jgi:hypothetical protein